MKLALPRMFQRRPHFERKSARYACQIDAQLTIIDRGTTFDGRIIDLSAGGAMFRPPLSHIMHRKDVSVCLIVGDEPVMGQIVSTTPSGFGVRFDGPLDDETLATILEHDKSEVIAKQKAARARS